MLKMNINISKILPSATEQNEKINGTNSNLGNNEESCFRLVHNAHTSASRCSRSSEVDMAGPREQSPFMI